MKALKIYLMVMGGLFTLAILAGIGVWFLYQDLPGANPSRYVNDPAQLEGASSTVPSEGGSVSSERSEEPVAYTITPDSLSERQRAVLRTFGMGDSTFAVTQPMIDCAVASIGEKRFGEILEGGAPSPLEAMSLLPCMKK